MTMGTFDFASLRAGRLAAARGALDRIGEVQFHRRQQRRRPGAGRRADRRRQTRVLRREGRTLATYGLASGPQGYRPLREFLVGKLKRDAGIACTADDILMVSGSLQALDLVNGALLARGDTVICEQDTYQGTLTRFMRLGVNGDRRAGRPRRHAHGRARGRAGRTARRAACGRR